MRLVDQPVECGPGEPYVPTDVDVLFGDPTVALRGPWNRTDLVKIGPAATDLVDRFEYHLDFPGDALDPGCDYEHWAAGSPQGATDRLRPCRDRARLPGEARAPVLVLLPVQRLQQHARGRLGDDPARLRRGRRARGADARRRSRSATAPTRAPRGAAWGDEKLEIVDGTHPVVYPAAGSHANKFTQALYLGSSAEAGVGCDDTRGPHRELTPVVKTIPSDPAAAKAAFPWIAFEGRWGELQSAFFNGPTGPNMKDQWTHPIEWSEDWRDTSYAVPTGGLFGTGATDLFCTGVAKGSKGLVLLLRNPPLMLLVLAAILGLLVFAVVRATWLPVAPLRIARRRSWGQILSASARMYVKRPAPLPRDRAAADPDRVRDHVRCSGSCSVVVDLLGTVTGQGAGAFASSPS